MESNSGGSGFIGLSGIKARHGVHDLIVDACNGTNDVHDLRIDIDTGQTGNAHRSDTAPGVHLIPGVIEGAGQAQTIRQTGLHTACDVPEGIVGHQHEQVDRCILAECSKLIGVDIQRIEIVMPVGKAYPLPFVFSAVSSGVSPVQTT